MQQVNHGNPAQAWLEKSRRGRDWLASPLGELLLAAGQPMLDAQLAEFFAGCLVHCGPQLNISQAPGVRCQVRLGAALPGMQIICEEQAWPLAEHAADLVVLQHALDFSLSPHGLLREAARTVRPGGHLLICGINPWSAWGLRRWLAHDGLREARCIAPGRLADWLALLGFALEKRRFGCYRPPLCAPAWQRRLAPLEHWGCRWQLAGGGVYLLLARKLMGGVRPLRPAARSGMGQLLPLPVAKVSRRDRGDR